MAWNIAVIIDPKYTEHAIDQVARYHPIWIIDTPSNRICATAARLAAGGMWEPEAACTTFTIQDPEARENNLLAILDTIVLHHPSIAKLNLVGVELSSSLISEMEEFGFIPARASIEDSIAFRRPVDSLKNAPTIQLDASRWKSADDLYTSLFEKLGAPAWHGRNFNALNDSIVTGGINSVEVPYSLSIFSLNLASSDARKFVQEFVDFVDEREADGCPTQIRSKTKPTREFPLLPRPSVQCAAPALPVR